MAIYHLHGEAISRSDGRSATAAAAYRAGAVITDERTGQIHDYRRKKGIEYTEIVLPENAPEWARDRSMLWNAAEKAENRKDSCVAREYEVAIPFELSPAERKRLVLDFSKEIVNEYGCAVDVAIHAPSKRGDERNYHAHILTTTRKIEDNGLSEKCDIEKAGRKRKVDLKILRARWSALANERLKENGIDVTINSKTLKAQGINREPTVHLGVAATAMERRGKKTELGEINRRAQQNAEYRKEIAAIEQQEAALQASIKTEKPAQRKLTDLPMDEQIKIYHAMREKFAEERRQKAQRITNKSEKRSQRRDHTAQKFRKLEPQQPTGILARFKQSAYLKAHEAWDVAQRHADRLAVEGQTMYYKLQNAVRDCKAWAVEKMRKTEPELVKSIDAHQQREHERMAAQREQQDEHEDDYEHGR